MRINFRCWEACTQGGFITTPLHIVTIQASVKGMVRSPRLSSFCTLSTNEAGNADGARKRSTATGPERASVLYSLQFGL